MRLKIEIRVHCNNGFVLLFYIYFGQRNWMLVNGRLCVGVDQWLIFTILMDFEHTMKPFLSCCCYLVREPLFGMSRSNVDISM